MFCQKKCTPMSGVITALCLATTLVGHAAVLVYVVSKCGCLKGRTKKLACECGDAVGDAGVRIAHAVDDCLSPDQESAKRRGTNNDCDC